MFVLFNMYKEIIKELKDKNVKLVLVSKTKPAEKIQHFYNLNQRAFGENRVQELVTKHEVLPKDIEWHLIGHLQKNKVKYIAPFVHLIHAVDNIDLLFEINKRALANNRTINVLLQIKIAQEESKFGLLKEDCLSLIQTDRYDNMNNINVIGLMGMATFTDNIDQVRNEFKQLKQFFDFLKQNQFKDKDDFKEISMGMSGDYKIAIEEGATMVRIGSLIMGQRS